MLPIRTDGRTTRKDRATQLLICEKLSLANIHCRTSILLLATRAVENAESARSVIYAIFSAHSAYFNVSRQKVPYFNVLRQNRVVFKTVLQQNNVEAC